MRDCLFKEEEVPDRKPPADAVIVEGIMQKFALHKMRLEGHRQDVIDMIGELPKEFLTGEGNGGGWSFLNLCMDKRGSQWGEHPTMEALCVLAIGLGMGKWCLPREMWSVLPGSMPYVQFTVPE